MISGLQAVLKIGFSLATGAELDPAGMQTFTLNILPNHWQEGWVSFV